MGQPALSTPDCDASAIYLEPRSNQLNFLGWLPHCWLNDEEFSLDSYPFFVFNPGFDQKPKTAFIYIELQDVGSLEKDQIKVDFGKRRLSVVVTNLKGKSHELNLPNLGGEIIPENCKYKVRKGVAQKLRP